MGVPSYSGRWVRIRVNGKSVRDAALDQRCNPDTAPATVSHHSYKQFYKRVDESDTSLNPGAHAPFVHDVAEGNIGGNLCVFRVLARTSFSAFPSLIPI